MAPSLESPGVLQAVGTALAGDAEALAALHDRELTPAMIAALRAGGFAGTLALTPATGGARAALEALVQGIATLPAAGDAAGLDDLAAEYAAIYLTGAYGASPCESVWLDDDRLVCQQPMFAWRALHVAADLEPPDWRRRADDHLVLQLQYIAHVLRRAQSIDAWRALADVLDMHTLRWLDEFAARIAARGQIPFYVGLVVYTAAWVDGLRDLLAHALGKARPTREAIEARARPPVPESVPLTFMPGAAPSW